MFKNYFKVAIRNLARHKLFSFINIFGLALSMSLCLIVIIRIKDQMGYDKFHPNSDKTYRILTTVTSRQGDEYGFATTPLPLGNVLKTDYDFAENVIRIYPLGTRTASSPSKELSITTAFTDAGFFNMFGFSLKAGDPGSGLAVPNSIVLSEETATKYFGKVNPLGQVISFTPFGSFQVTGVMNKPTGKSHIDFDAFISMTSVPLLERSGKLASISQQWSNGTSAYTYVTLKRGMGKSQLSKAVKQISSSLMKSTKVVGKEKFEFRVQPFHNIILGEDLQYNLGNTGSPEKVFAEIAICLVLLLSACFNYTNLSLARSLKRGKEVGIRKVSGAIRFQIFYQFVSESVLIAVVSLVAGIVMFKLIIDYAPFGAGLLPTDAAFTPELLLWFLIFALFTGLLAGTIPAWALSSFKPVEVLKNLSNIKLFGSNGLRKTLIVIQFALSLTIIVFTLTFYNQFRYLANGDTGYNVRNIINVPLNGADYQLLANDISRIKGVEAISATSTNLGRSAGGSVGVRHEKDKDAIQMEYYDVDQNFVRNMRLSLLAGSTFDKSADSTESRVVISDIGRKVLQFSTPEDAIGKTIWLNDTSQVQIVGVLKDFFYRGLETPYGPLLLRNRRSEFRNLHVKTTTAGDQAVLASVEKVWKQAYPLKQFEASWLYEDIYKRKSAWDTVSTLGFLAIVTITLACMGLLGMVVYNTETRRKEIGIRKVMGAGVAAIITLLSGNFLKLVIIAGLIALPVSYALTYFFLNIFANRISVGFGILSISFIGMLIISLLTIGSQIYKVAIANPVNALRSE